MKLSTLKTFLALGTLVGLGSSLLVTTSTGCDQPAPNCTSARGDYVVRYTYVSGPESCKELLGEKVGAQTYNGAGKENKPDLDNLSVALQADAVGTLRDTSEENEAPDLDPNNKAYSLGAFNTATPQGNICLASTLTPAHQVVPEVKNPDPDAGEPLQAKTDLSYTWANVRFLVTSQYYGSQMAADVTVKRNNEECRYQAQGLYPYVDCFKVKDPETGEPELDSAGKMIVDESFCAPEANPPAHPTGSGINPDFAVHCDPQLFACVLNSTTFPSINK